MTAGATLGRLATVVLDCDDPEQLAQFWSALLDRPVAEKTDTWWELEPLDGGIAIAFQKVGRHRPPDNRRPQQLHLDIAVDDLHESEQVVLALGATAKSETHTGGGKPWRVYVD